MNRLAWSTFFVAIFVSSLCASETKSRPPNILWFVVDDMSAQFSCYGETLIETPHVDRLAREGVRFINAHVTAPVCSTCRSAFMTGMYQASLGVHHHRSGRDKTKIRLPESVLPLPQLFQQAGYYTCNGNGLPNSTSVKKRAKTDYNFEWDARMYDGGDWAGRKPGQPFFMQVQLAGGKLRGASKQSFEGITARAKKEFGNIVDPQQVVLPPYYPRDPVLLQDWAAYLESVRLTDRHVGQVVARLSEEGILDDTLIIFMTDHGISHARGKQFNYREGTHVPFVVRGPGIRQGTVRDDLVEHIDMAAISLAAAGIPIPQMMQAQDVFAKDYQPRVAAFAARDRCDETVEFIRSVRSGDLLYVRNYNPFRPHLQPSRYKDGKEIVKTLRQLYAAKQLNSAQERLLFSPTRKGEELYDTLSDPYETRNLVSDPTCTEKLAQMRRMLDQYLVRTRDTGFIPEPLMSEIAEDPSQTIHAFAQSERDYPINDIVRLANLAIQRDVEALPQLKKQLTNPHRIMRYWAMVGLRVLGEAARPALPDVENGLNDSDASVRMTAASILGKLGQKERAARLLLDEAKAATTDAHALWALDGIKFLDTPQVIGSVRKKDVVRGEYSGRTYDFLSKGGLVYPAAAR